MRSNLDARERRPVQLGVAGAVLASALALLTVALSRHRPPEPDDHAATMGTLESSHAA